VNINTTATASTNPGGQRYRYWLFGEEHTAPNAIASTIDILQNLAQYGDDFLPKLALKVRGRTRNHLARSPSDVYPERPDLAQPVKEIAPGWFFGGNISNPEKIKIIRAACEVTGLVFGDHFYLKIDWPTKK
jgi:hypothetical protein